MLAISQSIHFVWFFEDINFVKVETEKYFKNDGYTLCYFESLQYIQKGLRD